MGTTYIQECGYYVSMMRDVVISYYAKVYFWNQDAMFLEDEAFGEV
jgi:hypothetical protein